MPGTRALCEVEYHFIIMFGHLQSSLQSDSFSKIMAISSASYWTTSIECFDQPADHCFILGDKQENLKSYPNYREPLSMVVAGRPIWRLSNVNKLGRESCMLRNIIPSFCHFTPDQSVPVVKWNAIQPAGLWLLEGWCMRKYQRKSVVWRMSESLL